MASKKKWKERAKRAEAEINLHFDTSARRATELAQIDLFLKDLQLPGPSLQEWAYQMRDALVDLAKLREVQVRDFSQNPAYAQEPLKSTPAAGSNVSPDGEYTFLTERDISPSNPVGDRYESPRRIKDNPQA